MEQFYEFLNSPINHHIDDLKKQYKKYKPVFDNLHKLPLNSVDIKEYVGKINIKFTYQYKKTTWLIAYPDIIIMLLKNKNITNDEIDYFVEKYISLASSIKITETHTNIICEQIIDATYPPQGGYQMPKKYMLHFISNDKIRKILLGLSDDEFSEEDKNRLVTFNSNTARNITLEFMEKFKITPLVNIHIDSLLKTLTNHTYINPINEGILEKLIKLGLDTSYQTIKYIVDGLNNNNDWYHMCAEHTLFKYIFAFVKNGVKLTGEQCDELDIYKSPEIFNYMKDNCTYVPTTRSLALACNSGNKDIVADLINMKMIPTKDMIKDIKVYDMECVKILVDNGLEVTIDLFMDVIKKGVPNVNNREWQTISYLVENGLTVNYEVIENMLSAGRTLTKKDLITHSIPLDERLFFICQKYNLSKYGGIACVPIKISAFRQAFSKLSVVRLKEKMNVTGLIPDQYCYDNAVIKVYNAIKDSNKTSSYWLNRTKHTKSVVTWLEIEYKFKPTFMTFMRLTTLNTQQKQRIFDLWFGKNGCVTSDEELMKIYVKMPDKETEKEKKVSVCDELVDYGDKQHNKDIKDDETVEVEVIKPIIKTKKRKTVTVKPPKIKAV